MVDLVNEFDWRAFWKTTLVNKKADYADSSHWDERAASFAGRAVSDYSKKFVDLLDLQEGEDAFEIGCGAGEIAILHAQAGNNIIAADFSKTMLSYFGEAAKDAGISDVPNGDLGSIKLLNMSWMDNWDEFGVGENCVDVAYASRSTIVPDLGKAFEKLSRVARKRCAVTISTGYSPIEDVILMDAIGKHSKPNCDMICAYNILYQMGYIPEVRIIASDKVDSYYSVDDAIKHAVKHVKNFEESDYEPIAEFISQHLIPNDTPGDDRPLKLDYQRNSDWAFISWNV